MKLLTISLLALITAQAQAISTGKAVRTASNGVVIETTITEDAEADKNVVAGVAAAGEIIQVGRDLVALGEELYVLVSKGRPHITAEYSPVSVLPRVGARAIDAQDLEGWKRARSYTINIEVKKLALTFARFQYKVIYNYGGTYNGRGLYITNAQIVPSVISVGYGTDFDATMKVSGMANRGTRAQPVATVMMQIRFKADTMFGAVTGVDTYELSGRGDLRKL